MKSLGYKISLIRSYEDTEKSRGSAIGYDSSVLKSGRREQSRETVTLKIEFKI